MSVHRVSASATAEQRTTRQKRATTFFTLLLTALALLVVYTFLHEAGHAIAALAFGGTMTGFSIAFWDLSAHVGLEGSFSSAQRGIIDISGALLPVLAWASFILLVPKEVNPVLQWLKLASSLLFLSSLLPWVIIPLLASQTEGDDVTKFLTHSVAPPWLVAGLFLLLFLGGWTLVLRKLPKLREVFLSFRHGPVASAPEAKRTLGALAALAVLIAAAAFGLDAYSNPNLPLPAGYAHVVTLKLSAQTLQSTEVHRFTLLAPAQVSYHITLRNVGSGPAEILLREEGGFAMALMRAGAQFEASRAHYTPTYALAPGSYRLELSFPQAPGQVMVAWRAEALEP